MFGVLVDVSGSMESSYALDELHRDDVSVERTHAVFTTIMKIVEREVTHHKRRESIFACAFGLRKPELVCDLIELFAVLRDLTNGRGREDLVKLAKQNGAPHAEEWIRNSKYLTDKEAALLNWLLRQDESLLSELIKKLPSARVAQAAKIKCKAADAVNTLSSTATSRVVNRSVNTPSCTETSRVVNRSRARSRIKAALCCVSHTDDESSPLLLSQGTLPPQVTSPSPSSTQSLAACPVLPPPPPPPPPPPETAEDRAVKSSEAYKFAKKLISERSAFFKTLEKTIEPKSVQYVSKLMAELMEPAYHSTSSSINEQHGYIQELINEISPFIYGCTPLCKAMNVALRIFKQRDAGTTKVLFVLSDGVSTDGDPLPIAQDLHALGVRIVTCYLTSDNIDNPKSMFYEQNPDWDKGQLDLFKMSSTMKNTHTPVSYLIDAGWELPPSGESRLFVQANCLNIANELCETVVARLTESCDALVDLLGKVPLATYINQANADFVPRHQQGATCYAHAIAATFHLAMHRIVGLEGGVPDFETIRDHIIHIGEEYEKMLVNGRGVNTVHVLEAVCPEYRLQYKAVYEIDARKAINERRPVVARFRMCRQQWDKFADLFENNPKKILERTDLETEEPTGDETFGHAVVLTRCDPDCLTFMNSWGTGWADGGFFRVKDHSVLNKLEFYDVYWTENDLTKKEKKAFKTKGAERAKQVMEEFPSLKDLVYQCPICGDHSKIVEFNGNLLEAECPKCCQKFKPTSEDILQSLYNRNMKH